MTHCEIEKLKECLAKYQVYYWEDESIAGVAKIIQNDSDCVAELDCGYNIILSECELSDFVRIKPIC